MSNLSDKVVGSAGTGLGVGQTWQDMTASRAKNTNYTNTTGRTIMVSGWFSDSNTYTITGYIDGVPVAAWYCGASFVYTMNLIVPAGSTYQVYNSGATLTKWFELR